MMIYETCPYCGKSIFTNDKTFEVKTKRKTIIYVHWSCYEKNKRGNK